MPEGVPAVASATSPGPVSAALEQELALEVRRQGILVWLDRDGQFTAFVDRLAERAAKGEFSCPVVGFRGSFLSLLFALEEHGSGYDKHPLVIHMPGHNEDSIRETPVLELYAAGTRFRKGLDTLVRQAAAGRALPDEVDAFLASNPTLEEADAWLGRPAVRPAAGLAALLEASGPVLLVEGLAQRSSTLAEQVAGESERQVLWDYMRKLLAIDERWFAFAAGTPKAPPAGLQHILNALGAWILCVEYVHDLRRPPGHAALQPLKTLSPTLVKSATGLVSKLREHHPDAYERVADEVSALLFGELKDMTAADLGQIDTFREEDDKVLVAAIEALKAGRWAVAVGYCKDRLAGRSFWIARDQIRRREWELVAEAAGFGALLAQHPRPLGEARDHLEALTGYAGPGCLVDRAHRRFEQQHALRLEPLLPHFGALNEVLSTLRGLHRDWADQLARDFSRVCKTMGFLPPSELRQRSLFQHIVPPLMLGGEKVAVFLVDALRYEMAAELCEELRAISGGAAIDLKPRLAELPTITAVGMNALAPVARADRLTVAGEFKGFRTGEYTVNSPDSRCRAMGASAGGGNCLRLELADLCERTRQAVSAIKDHQLIVVDTTEIDAAGEANVGLHTFEATLRQLRAGWHHLQAAGVKQAVFTADHGFLLQDGTGAVPFGRRTDPRRRYVLDEHERAEDGVIPVSLASLGYDGLSGYLLLREDTAPFATPRPERFVHGGNSPQERIIPVLTITRKQAEASGLSKYAVEVQPMDGVMGCQRLRLRVVFPPGTQTSLAYAGPRTIDLDLRAFDRPGVRVTVKEVSGGASLKAGRIQAPVGETWSEVFFTMEGPSDDRTRVEVWHADAIQNVASAVADKLFFVTGSGQAPQPPPSRSGGGPPAWAERLEDERVRAVFVHIDRHGSIAETELIAILGSAGAARRFALNFDAHLAKIPFEVRSESNASGKRYVREEDK